MAAVDMDEGAGEGWGDDADLILDEGEFNSFSCAVQVYWFMVFNVTFNTISGISWQSVLLVEEPECPQKITDLPQVTFFLIKTSS